LIRVHLLVPSRGSIGLDRGEQSGGECRAGSAEKFPDDGNRFGQRGAAHRQQVGCGLDGTDLNQLLDDARRDLRGEGAIGRANQRRTELGNEAFGDLRDIGRRQLAQQAALRAKQVDGLRHGRPCQPALERHLKIRDGLHRLRAHQLVEPADRMHRHVIDQTLPIVVRGRRDPAARLNVCKYIGRM
jgi:hypothetical protein